MLNKKREASRRMPGSSQQIKKIILMMLAMYSHHILAGPPFITDDPYPTDYKHWEIYLFSFTDKNNAGLEAEFPALEINYGIFHRVQLSVTVPMVSNLPRAKDEPNAAGLGDLEVELKYAFIKENKTRPQVAIEPIFVAAAGDAERDLGNGRGCWFFPIWIGKSGDKGEVYGGGGYALNSAPGARNFFFGGIATEYDVTDKLMLGGEIFAQGEDAIDTRPFALINLGGSYEFSKTVSFLFSIGHSVIGEKHFVSYLALNFNT